MLRSQLDSGEKRHFLPPAQEKFPNSIIYYYMDDTLIAAPSSEMLAKTYTFFKKAVSNAGLIIAPEKV